MIDLDQFEGHTLGPLSVFDMEAGVIFVGKEGKDVCLLFNDDKDPRIEADARLFAAAPSLLAELREARELIKKIIAIATCGGWCGLTEGDALTEIRKLTRKRFRGLKIEKKDVQDALEAAGGEG